MSNRTLLDGFAPATGSSVSTLLPAASGDDGVSVITPAMATTTAPPTKQRTAKKRSSKNNVTPASSSEGVDYTEDAALRPLSEVSSEGFEPMGLPQIHFRLGDLLDKLPNDLPSSPPLATNHYSDIDIVVARPTNGVVHNDPRASVLSFASALQVVVEEYNLLLSLVSSAVYRWGVDRSGASQQNLSVMNSELQQCQDVIASVVSSRLSNVLCPAKDIMVGEIEIVRNDSGGENGHELDGEVVESGKKRKLSCNSDRQFGYGSGERRINHYIRPLVDPTYVQLCDTILVRNAGMIRHAVATSIHTAKRVIGDYLNAMKKDTSHDVGKGGYY
jgi:hypothetical protein